MSTSPVPAQMRAAVLEKFNTPYQVKTRPSPTTPQGHDILIKTLAASYCHTDAVFAEGLMSQELPRVGCHEFAGKIIALGQQVDPDLGLSIGREVGVPGRAYHPCGECHECKLPSDDRPGYSPYCKNAKNLGLTADGGFQEYVLVDSRQVAPIPPKLTALDVAPLMCAGVTVWAALDKVKDATRIAIMGAGGGLGHLGVQFAAYLGKEVVAIDVGEQKTRLLDGLIRELGDAATSVTVVDCLTCDSKSLLKQLTKSSSPTTTAGVDAVILLPGSQAALDYGMVLLRDHGTMVVVSFPETPFQISAKDLVFRDIKVIGSLVGRNFQLKQMLQFAADHNVRAVTTIYPLEKINEAVSEFHKGVAGKLVINPTA